MMLDIENHCYPPLETNFEYQIQPFRSKIMAAHHSEDKPDSCIFVDQLGNISEYCIPLALENGNNFLPPQCLYSTNLFTNNILEN